MAKVNLQTATARKRLVPRGKPYKIALLPGVWLGYRAARSGTGAWIVIAADGSSGYWTDAFAHADDRLEADGVKVLTYEQAANRCRALARGDANAAADRPATIAESISAFETDLTGRGRISYNARWVRLHVPPHLAAQPLTLVTAKALRAWRDGLLKGGMIAPTVNRLMKNAKAAFSLAAKLDKRVRANAGEWKVGLEALPDFVVARDAVLSDAQVRAVVRCAYEELLAVGVYVQTHAETGARSSQLARLLVGDLQAGRLMIPVSNKGRGQRKADRTPVPLTKNLEARLRAAAAGRPASAPLLLRADGQPWQPKNATQRRPFERAARAAKLPAGSTIYSLRHSSITRALLRGVPIRITASWHDTSTAMIEKHYAAFIRDHYDDLVRSALLDTGAELATVVPIRA